VSFALWLDEHLFCFQAAFAAPVRRPYLYIKIA